MRIGNQDRRVAARRTLVHCHRRRWLRSLRIVPTQQLWQPAVVRTPFTARAASARPNARRRVASPRHVAEVTGARSGRRRAAHRRRCGQAVRLRASSCFAGHPAGAVLGEARAWFFCDNRPMQAMHVDAPRPPGSATPLAAGGLVFLIAFCDALAVVGIVVPALPLLFAVRVMIGLDPRLRPMYALPAIRGGPAPATLAWIGRRCSASAPARRWFVWRKSAIARSRRTPVSPPRQQGASSSRASSARCGHFVPAVAGMLRMPLLRAAISG